MTKRKGKHDRQLEAVALALITPQPQTLDDLAAASRLSLAEVVPSLALLLTAGFAEGDMTDPDRITYRRKPQ